MSHLDFTKSYHLTLVHTNQGKIFVKLLAIVIIVIVLSITLLVYIKKIKIGEKETPINSVLQVSDTSPFNIQSGSVYLDDTPSVAFSFVGDVVEVTDSNVVVSNGSNSYDLDFPLQCNNDYSQFVSGSSSQPDFARVSARSLSQGELLNNTISFSCTDSTCRSPIYNCLVYHNLE